MATVPKSITRLIDLLKRLPGIGPRSAERLTYHLLRMQKEDVKQLADALIAIKEKVRTCNECYNFSDSDLCSICSDSSRSHLQIMIVEEPLDVTALEKTMRFKGVYHVLGGVIDPIAGIGTDEIRINELVARIKKALEQNSKNQLEIIIATNPSTEGEMTAVIIRKILRKEFGDDLNITRIARGLPVGGDVDYADPITLMRSLEGRTQY